MSARPLYYLNKAISLSLPCVLLSVLYDTDVYEYCRLFLFDEYLFMIYTLQNYQLSGGIFSVCCKQHPHINWYKLDLHCLEIRTCHVQIDKG